VFAQANNKTSNGMKEMNEMWSQNIHKHSTKKKVRDKADGNFRVILFQVNCHTS
jgi:hypothetical protein